MNFILKSLIALGMAVPALSSVYLHFPTEKDLVNGIHGELSIEISGTTGDDMSEACDTILLQAFDASYKQVYGFDGMMVVIEEETVVPEATGGGAVRRRLPYSTWNYVVNFVSDRCQDIYTYTFQSIAFEKAHTFPQSLPLYTVYHYMIFHKTIYYQQQRCRYCSRNPSLKEQVLSDLRADQEVVLLAMIKASTCEAFHTATAVTLAGVTAFVDGAAIDTDAKKTRE
jgi:hypothetical protein